MFMAFDFKKEYKEFYLPPKKPVIVDVPAMNYVAVRGKGDPNREDGAYKASISALYRMAFAIKMSKKGEHGIEGYFDFVVPPLEGLWYQAEDRSSYQMDDKENLSFISMIRLPDFVKKEDLSWAQAEIGRKSGIFPDVEFFRYEEGLCVQMLHIGGYDAEMESVSRMQAYLEENGYEEDFSFRFHHEIYLSDPRRCEATKLRTVLRHPVRRKKEGLL